MKTTMIATICLILLATASARPPKQTPHAGPPAKTLEAKIRKAWDDYKTKNKDAFAAILTDDFTELEEANGFGDKKTILDEIDQFQINQYNLHDFKVKPVGADGALVNYLADYSGSYAGQPVDAKTAYGEIWVKRGNDWKLLYAQETKVK